MSISVTPLTFWATTQAKDKRDALTLALVLVVICLGNLALVLASGTFTQAVELTGLVMSARRSQKLIGRPPLTHGGAFFVARYAERTRLPPRPMLISEISLQLQALGATVTLCGRRCRLLPASA